MTNQEVELFPSREEIERLRLENDQLRGILAWSSLPCIYCGLSLGDQTKCQSGFPGCARADDMMIGSTPVVAKEESE